MSEFEKAKEKYKKKTRRKKKRKRKRRKKSPHTSIVLLAVRISLGRSSCKSSGD